VNASDLNTVFVNNDLSTGLIQAVYTFESGSGCILFNDLYPTGEQVQSGNLTLPIVEKSPAVSITCSSSVIDNLSTSSGIFTGAETLQVIEKINTGDWTFFIDYKQDDSNHGNTARVLVSTMSDYTGASGFNFGVNGSNRPYFEYIDSGSVRRIHTHPKDVGINNLISVSQTENAVLITNHDIGSFQHESHQFEINDFVESDTLYFGNFPTGTNVGYAGFSGDVDSFILYKGALAGEDQNIIAENYFYSGIQSGFTSGTLVSGREVTGVDVNLTGLTGTGITGYVSVIHETIESCLCGDINFYKNSGVSGELFGQVVTYLTGTGFVTGQDFTEIGPQRINDYSKTLKYAEKGITFLEKVPDDSVVEVYSFETFHTDKLNLPTTFVGGASVFFTFTGYTGGNINVFANGLAQYSGTEFTVVDDLLGSKNIDFVNNNFSGSDNVIFDIITGTQSSLYTFSGFDVTGLNLLTSGSGYTSVPEVIFNGGENAAATAITGESGGTTKVTGLTLISGGSGFITAPTITIQGGGASTAATAEAFIDQNNYTLSSTDYNDPYLNGYKLVSGLDFTQTASAITLIATQVQNSKYTTGNIIFLPRINSDYLNFTGTASQFVNTNISLVEEQVWLNGKRVELDKDYIKVSNLSLLKPSGFVTGFNNTIYNNTNDFFNT
jgi:hypothetical protein